MMTETGLWLTPLVLLPGVGLLLMSTAIRYGQVHEEFHHYHGQPEISCIHHLLKRAKLFRNALIFLYVSAACLALASLSGGIFHLASKSPLWPVMLMTGVAVLVLLLAVIELIRESCLSLEIIEKHANELTS